MAEDVSPTPESLVVTPAAPPAGAPAEPAPAEPQAQAEPAAEVAADAPVVSEPAEQPQPAASAPHEEEPAAAEDEDVAEDEEEAVDEGEPAAAAEVPPENKKKWYVVKVQSNREDTIKEAIERRVRKEGLEEFFGQIVIPVEKFTEVKTDKNGRFSITRKTVRSGIDVTFDLKARGESCVPLVAILKAP